MKRILLIVTMAIALCSCNGCSSDSKEKVDLNKNYTRQEIANMSADEIANIFISYSNGIIDAYKNDDYERAVKLYDKGDRLSMMIEGLYEDDILPYKKVEKIYEQLEKYNSKMADTMQDVEQWMDWND